MITELHTESKLSVGLFRLVVILFLIMGCSQPDPSENSEKGPFSTPIVYSDTTIRWSSDDGTINLNRSIVIDESSVLIIEAGVHINYVDSSMLYYADWDIEFLGPPRVTIEGSLRCNGSAEYPVNVTGGENRSEYLDIHHEDQSISKPIVINWLNGVEGISIVGGSPSIMHSNFRFILLEDCDSVNIERSVVDEFSSIESSGTILNNRMRGHILSIGGLFQIDSNIIGNDSSRGLFGFKSQNDDVSSLRDNVIKNFETAVHVFSGSPTLNQNNIIDFYCPVVVLPHAGQPDTDTLDFSNNWWGTSYGQDIINGIDFVENGGTLSEKTIDVLPIAITPFELDD